MMTQEGLNRVRDIVKNDITQGQAGTDGTLPTKNDTALVAPVDTTKTSLTFTTGTSPATIHATHSITTAQGNGNSLKEWELLHSNGDTFCRIVTTGLSKTSSISVERIVTIEIDNE
ncbi:hypothetical protein HYU06_05860 [Candidatus Woesearchaeota archaeon]|nr:hypothetical protein [Candidatus Woesearchaeota archaeon]